MKRFLQRTDPAVVSALRKGFRGRHLSAEERVAYEDWLAPRLEQLAEMFAIAVHRKSKR